MNKVKMSPEKAYIKLEDYYNYTIALNERQRKSTIKVEIGFVTVAIALGIILILMAMNGIGAVTMTAWVYPVVGGIGVTSPLVWNTLYTIKHENESMRNNYERLKAGEVNPKELLAEEMDYCERKRRANPVIWRDVKVRELDPEIRQMLKKFR